MMTISPVKTVSSIQSGFSMHGPEIWDKKSKQVLKFWTMRSMKTYVHNIWWDYWFSKSWYILLLPSALAIDLFKSNCVKWNKLKNESNERNKTRDIESNSTFLPEVFQVAGKPPFDSIVHPRVSG